MSVNPRGELNALEEAILLSTLDGEIPLTAVDDLGAAYAPGIEDWESWGFLGWFALTPDGEKAAEGLQAKGRALHVKGEPAAGRPWARNRESSTPT